MSQFPLMNIPGVGQVPIVPDKLSPDFIENNRDKLIFPEGSEMLTQAPEALSPNMDLANTERVYRPSAANIPTMQQIRQRELREEEDRIRRRRENIRNAPRVGVGSPALPESSLPSLDPGDIRRAATASLRQRTERDQLRRDQEGLAEMDTARSELNALQAENEDRIALGLDPLPIPEDLINRAGVSDMPGSDGEAVDPSQIVGAPQRSGQQDGLASTAISGLEEGFQRRAIGIEQETDARVSGFQRQADELARTAEQLEAFRKEDDLRRETRIQQLESQVNRFRDEVEKLSDFQFDPSGGFSSMSGLNKVLTAIAIGMGGQASAILGRPNNETLGIIESAIKRDIDTQVREYNALAGQADAQNTIFSKMMNIFGEENDAREAAEAALLQSTAFRVEAIKAKTESEAIRGQAQQLQGNLITEYTQLELGLLEKLMAKPEINVSERTAKQMQEVMNAEGLIQEIENEFSKLRAETGVLGRIPGTRARIFNAAVQRRLFEIQSVLAQTGPRSDRIRRQLLAQEGMGAASFEKTVDGILKGLRSDLRTKRNSILGVSRAIGEDVEGFGPIDEDFGFERPE